MATVLTLSLTDNKGDIVTVLGFAVPVIGALIAWMQQQAHSQNVANQKDIVDKIEESKP
ncbi:MAG: hypothetical protein KGL39_25680 [Patescibacteria group bacterium]|nr:hypothetical protein [Patescibacteria group bacterium]